MVYVPVNSKTAHAPSGQTPGHLTFLKNIGQIPRYVASLDGQMAHPLELQRSSNPPPSRHVKANCGNKFCKIFSHYEFLVQLVFAPHFKQRHIPRYNYIYYIDTGVLLKNIPLVNIDYFIESATYGFLFTSCKTLENVRVSAANE